MGRPAFIRARVITGYLQEDIEIFIWGIPNTGKLKCRQEEQTWVVLLHYHHRYFILPLSWLWAIIITIIILQIINSLQKSCSISRSYDQISSLQMPWLLLIKIITTYHTQAANVLASCSSWPSEPGIVLLQVKYLQSIIACTICLVVTNMSIYQHSTTNIQHIFSVLECMRVMLPCIWVDS